MGTAKVVSLKARAYQTSHLCFPVSGIIEDLRAVVNRLHLRTAGSSTGTVSTQPIGTPSRPIQLGDSVTQFDFAGFCSGLSRTASGDASRLVYDSSTILGDPKVQASLLMTLRAESVAAVLDKAINARQNAYFSKYANQAEVVSVLQKCYTAKKNLGSPSTTKPDALAELSSVAANQTNDLLAAYKKKLLPTVPSLDSVVASTGSVLKTTGDFPDTDQKITNTDYAYRTPSYETQAQGLRAQVSLIDQQVSQFMSGQSLPHLAQVFSNELQGIDLDVKRLQIGYLNTILTSPIQGVITGIYKNYGDWVQAGEPVIRVEDNNNAILIGTLSYQGLISVGSQMTITTSLFDSSNAPSIVANVIAVRGRANEDDMWEVHAVCTNTGDPVLPVNYHFDYDDTTVTVAP